MAMLAVVMIFEMTLDYNIILPITVTVALSYGVRKLLSKESIYTLKLARRGHYMPEALQTNFSDLKQAKDIMEIHFGTVLASSTLAEFAGIACKWPAPSTFLVENANHVLGIITRDAALGALDQRQQSIKLRDIMNTNYITAGERATLFDIIASMHANDASVALITSGNGLNLTADVKGVITESQVLEATVRSVEFFAF